MSWNERPGLDWLGMTTRSEWHGLPEMAAFCPNSFGLFLKSLDFQTHKQNLRKTVNTPFFDFFGHAILSYRPPHL